MTDISTTCITCRVSTAVGPHRGYFGLPSLKDRAGVVRENGFELGNWLAEGRTSGDQSFGYLYGGFKALEIVAQPLETYAAFLGRHAAHRLLAWVDRPNDLLLEALGLSLDLPFEPYVARAQDGFEEAILVFRCKECDVEVEGYEPELIKSFSSRVLTKPQVDAFSKRVLRNYELNISHSSPSQIELMEVDDFWQEHARHSVSLELRA